MQAEPDPNLIVYFRGGYMPLRDANVGILTHALHYGTGVFEGIRAHWNEEHQQLYVLRMAEHYARWKDNCGILRIQVPASVDELCDITLQLLRRNNLRTNTYIRPLAFKSAQRVGVAPDDQDAFALIAMPFGAYLHAENGLHVGVSSWRRIEDQSIPARAKICGAYVNSVLATDEARQSGFDEALLLNANGHVAEGATCNLFMVRHGKLITPPVSDNILEGITRDCVLQLAESELNAFIVERSIDRSELLVCDELFLSGTAVGIAPITRIDHHLVRNGTIGPMTARLQDLYTAAANGRLRAYQHWLTPVYPKHVKPEQDHAIAEYHTA